jgi:hypothetical protein
MRANLRLGNTVTSNNEKIPYRTYYRTVLPGRYSKKVTDKNADRSHTNYSFREIILYQCNLNAGRFHP